MVAAETDRAPPPRRRRVGLLVTVTAIVICLFGLYLLLGGGWLLSLGGSAYYLIAGACLVGVAWLLIRGSRAAYWLYAALLAGTLIWAVFEVGFDFWALAPRGDVLVPLAVWLLLPFVWRDLRPRAPAGPLLLSLVVAASLIVYGRLAVFRSAPN